ncbi:hypothetical protein CEQ90_06820 [Lewinellaceae bacterium SD302]|nr:hypothetical protein CEQ90_06820 [Lewinellaceae bacterium SD302]
MRIPLLLTLFLFTAGLIAQTSQVKFGKNRVQYHEDFADWRQYESDNFITYWYGEGRNIGQLVVMYAEQDFAEIQNILEHRMNEKVQLIVYVDITDVKQSNIGGEEVFSLPGTQNANRSSGYVNATQTKFLGNKAFVYFNGDHNDLRRQVREAVSSVYLEHMLFGSSVQEVVQNALLMNLPDWFKSGLVAYLGEQWNATLDNQLRGLLNSGKYEDFQELADDYPRLAGHAFWYYISQNYGEPTVSSLLYLTRINRSLETGFLFVLGSPYQTVLFNWKEFFNSRYADDQRGRAPVSGQEVAIKNKRGYPMTQLKMSPDGQKIAYVLNDIGRYWVYIQDMTTGERKKVFRGGQRNLLQATDFGYPLLAWNVTNQELAVMYEFRDVPKLLRYDLNTEKSVTEDLGPQLQRVHSMEYANPGTMVLSATRSGFSDIYLYYPATRQSVPITNDFFDDLDAMPVRLGGNEGVIFASNRIDTLLSNQRLDTILPAAQFDLYYYDLTNKIGELVRLSNTPLADERSPVAINEKYFAYLSDESGIYNRYRGYLEEYIHHLDQIITLEDGTEIRLHQDSSLAELDTSLIERIVLDTIIRQRAITTPTTNYDQGMTAQSFAARRDRGIGYFRTEDGAKLYLLNVDTLKTARPELTAYQRYAWRKMGMVPPQLSGREVGSSERTLPDTVRQNTSIAPTDQSPETVEADAYLFQSRFEEVAPPPPLDGSIQTDDPIPTPVDTSRGDLPRTIVAQPPPNRPRPRPVNGNLRGEMKWLPREKVYRFRPGKIIPYRTTFRVNYLKTTADNDPLFDGLNTFSGNPDGFTQQPLGILVKGNIMDLFEDHVIEGGVRVPTSFNGTEYFLIYHNRRKRLDTYYAAYRRNRRREEGGLVFGPRRIDDNTLLGQFGVRYPLDVFRSIRATATIRRDRVQALPTEQAALQEPAFQQQRIGARLEYVFDNTLDLAENLRQGTRYKIYADAYKSFNISFDEDGDSGFEPGMLGVIGADFRHYQRLDKLSIFALRFAGATNFGAQKILYYLGGADNSLSLNFNNAIPTPTPANGNFVFQDLANPLRGFDINSRNGSSYVLGNAELRVPAFRYLFKRINSSLIRNFQLVGFFDIGTAWIGDSPFSSDNPVNVSNYPDLGTPNPGPVTVEVTRFREPIIYGYGVGARTSLFGYFIRVDYGWGVETETVNPGKWHLSLGYDF